MRSHAVKIEFIKSLSFPAGRLPQATGSFLPEALNPKPRLSPHLSLLRSSQHSGPQTLRYSESRIERTSVLVLAGSGKNLAAYDEIYAFYHICKLSVDPVLIVGSGRVGDTIAQRFKERGSPYMVIEKNPKRLQDEEHYVVGDAGAVRFAYKLAAGEKI